MKKLLLLTLLVALSYDVRTQNLVVNPALEIYNGSQEGCKSWIGDNNYFINKIEDYPGWIYKVSGAVHCEACNSDPCDPYRFKVYSSLSDPDLTILNPNAYSIKGASAHYGSAAFELINTSVRSIDRYKSEPFIPPAVVIGSSSNTIHKGATYFFSVWLSTEYEAWVVENPEDTRAQESYVTADFGLDLWGSGRLNEFESRTDAEKNYFFESLELDAVNPAQNIITGNADSNWVELRFVFTAQEDADYFVFGNFPMAINRPRTIDYNPYFQYNRSVDSDPWEQFNYFADAFTLMPYPELGDTLYLRAGDSIVLDPNTPDADLYWYDDDGGSNRTIYCPGTYWVRSSSQFTSVTDSVVILPANTWPSDTVLCQPNAELRLNEKAYNISWSTGEDIPTIQPTAEGPYEVTFAMPGGCEFKLNTNVSFDRVLLRNLKDTVVCDSLQLALKDVENQQYLWSTGNASVTLNTDKPGLYRITVNNENCTRTDSFVLQIDTATALKARDSSLCIGDYFEFQPDIPFEWNWVSETSQQFTDSADIIINWQQPACGLQQDTFLLRFRACDCKAFIPNAFSPNGDGRNDLFQPILRCEPLSFRLTIYNRWGQVLFTTDDHLVSWNPEGLPIGAYYYTLHYQGDEDRKWYNRHGFVQAIK